MSGLAVDPLTDRAAAGFSVEWRASKQAAEYNWHVLYTEYLWRILDGEVTQFLDTEYMLAVFMEQASAGVSREREAELAVLLAADGCAGEKRYSVPA